MIRRLLPFVGCLLWGCAVAPLPAPSAAGAQFDGKFTGVTTLVRGGGWLCGPATYQLALWVKDGRFDYPFPVNVARTTPISVQLTADGTFVRHMLYGTQDYAFLSLYKTDWVTIEGGIAGGTLEATVTDERCTRRITAQRG